MAAIVGPIIGGLLSGSTASQNAEAANNAASLQYAITKRIQDRLDALFALWKNEYLQCELALKNSICSLQEKTYQYRTASNRAITEVRKQFTRARVEALRCLPLNCVGASCAIERQMDIAEMGAAAWASNAAIRSEELRVDTFNQTIRAEKYRMAAFGRQHYMNVNAEAGLANMYGNIANAARAASSDAMYGLGRFLQQGISAYDKLPRTTPQPTGYPGTPDFMGPPNPDGYTSAANGYSYPDQTLGQGTSFSGFGDDQEPPLSITFEYERTTAVPKVNN
jgi:hypothetical protein